MKNALPERKQKLFFYDFTFFDLFNVHKNNILIYKLKKNEKGLNYFIWLLYIALKTNNLNKIILVKDIKR